MWQVAPRRLWLDVTERPSGRRHICVRVSYKVIVTHHQMAVLCWSCSLFMWEGIHGQQSGHVTEWRAEERKGRGDVFSDVRGGGVVKTGSVGQWVTGPGAPLVLLSSAVSLTPSLITGRRHVMTSAQAVKGKCSCSFTWTNDLNSVFD